MFDDYQSPGRVTLLEDQLVSVELARATARLDLGPVIQVEELQEASSPRLRPCCVSQALSPSPWSVVRDIGPSVRQVNAGTGPLGGQFLALSSSAMVLC